MEKNLHKIDEVFQDAQGKTNETPPPDGWEKLNAALDKQYLERYKTRFFTWKKIAILLFLILSGFILYQSGLFKLDSKSNGKLASTNYPQYPQQQTIKDPQANEIDKQKQKDKSSENLPSKSKQVTESEFPDRNNRGGQNSFVQNTKSLNDYSSIPASNKRNRREPRITDVEQVTNLKDVQIFETNNYKSDIENKDKTLLTLKREDSKLIKQNQQQEKSLVANNEKVISLNENDFNNSNQKINPYSLLSNAVSELIISKAENKKFKPYWSVSPYYSLDIASYKIDNDLTDTGNPQNESEKVLKRETHEQSFTVGFNLKKQLSKRISLNSGFSFSATSIGIMPEVIYVTSEKGQLAYKYIISSGYALINPVSGAPLTLGDSIKSAEAQHNIQSISIPFAVGYTFYKKRFDITPSAGVSANVITRANLQTEISDGQNKTVVSTNKLYGTKKYYTNFLATINLQYNLNKRLALNFTPSFKYALNSITKNNVVNTYPYSIGFGVCATFKL